MVDWAALCRLAVTRFPKVHAALKKSEDEDKLQYKFKVGDVVIFVNDFGVVYRWTISELTTYQPRRDGPHVPAYLHEGTQTPWFPTEETRLKKATDLDKMSTQAELQQKYGFTPTEWYGCY